MKTRFWTEIPKVLNGGTVTIRAEDWEPVIRAAKDDFKGEISIRDHDEMDTHRRCRYGSTPHYFVEISMNEEKAFEFIQMVEPMVHQIAMRERAKRTFRS